MATLTGWEAVEVPDPEGVLNRLAELNVPLAFLLEAVRRGQLAADFVTASHPVFYRGVVQYSETNGALREQFAELAWYFNDDDNIARVVSPDGRVILTAVSGNERTGLRQGPPAQTRRPRRSAGRRIVRRNLQVELRELLPEDERRRIDHEIVNDGLTWFLLFFRDSDIVRSELSLAHDVSEAGDLLEWSERLPLPDIDLLDGSPPAAHSQDYDGPDSDVDVPVERRAS